MIRLVQDRDLQEILDIYNHAIVHTTAVYHYKPHTLEMRKAWVEQKRNEGYPIFVLEEEGRVIGFATYGPFRPWPAYKYTIEHSVYVDPDYHNRGAGSKLLAKLIESAKEREYATIVGGIDATNEASIKLHEKFGFEHSGTIRKAGYKFGRWLDLAFYQLVLEGQEHPTEG